MAYTIRLPDALDLQARERANSLGLSVNGLISVALDAYLNRRGPAAAEPRPEPAAAAPGPLDRLGQAFPRAALATPAPAAAAGQRPAPILTRQQRRELDRQQAKQKG